MGIAETFHQQAEALRAAAEASDRLDGSLERLSQTEAGILALQRQAAAQARSAPARLLGPDGRPIASTGQPGGESGPFEPLPPILAPRTTSGPAGAPAAGAGIGTGGEGGATGRTGRFPWEKWAAVHCTLATLAMPDGSQKEAWDCRQATGDPTAIYVVPGYVTAQRGKRIGRGGGSGGGLTAQRPGFPERTTVFNPGEPAGTTFTGLPGGSATPTAGEREIVRAVQSQTARLEGELRQIRQSAQRYRGGVELRAGGLL